MWWKKLSGVTRSRRKNARTSCLWIGWYLVNALRWKYSWNNFLCCRHQGPYGIWAGLILQSILHRSAFLTRPLRWKECNTYSSCNIVECFLSEWFEDLFSNRSVMTSKELKITKCWPRTLKYITSPEMSSYLWRQTIDDEGLTIDLTPMIINKPGFVYRHIENVTN